MVVKYGYGWLPDIPDGRDFLEYLESLADDFWTIRK